MSPRRSHGREVGREAAGQGQGQQVTDLRLYRQVLMNRLRGLSKTAVAMEAVGKVR